MIGSVLIITNQVWGTTRIYGCTVQSVVVVVVSLSLSRHMYQIFSFGVFHLISHTPHPPFHIPILSLLFMSTTKKGKAIT